MGGTRGKTTLAPKASSKSSGLFFTLVRKYSKITTEKLSQMWILYHCISQPAYLSGSNKMHLLCTYWVQLMWLWRGGSCGGGDLLTICSVSLTPPALGPGIPSARWSWDCDMVPDLPGEHFWNGIFDFWFFFFFWGFKQQQVLVWMARDQKLSVERGVADCCSAHHASWAGPQPFSTLNLLLWWPVANGRRCLP